MTDSDDAVPVPRLATGNLLLTVEHCRAHLQPGTDLVYFRALDEVERRLIEVDRVRLLLFVAHDTEW